MISACSALMAAPIGTVRTKPSGIAKFIVPLLLAMENGVSNGQRDRKRGNK